MSRLFAFTAGLSALQGADAAAESMIAAGAPSDAGELVKEARSSLLSTANSRRVAVIDSVDGLVAAKDLAVLRELRTATLDLMLGFDPGAIVPRRAAPENPLRPFGAEAESILRRRHADPASPEHLDDASDRVALFASDTVSGVAAGVMAAVYVGGEPEIRVPTGAAIRPELASQPRSEVAAGPSDGWAVIRLGEPSDDGRRAVIPVYIVRGLRLDSDIERAARVLAACFIDAVCGGVPRARSVYDELILESSGGFKATIPVSLTVLSYLGVVPTVGGGILRTRLVFRHEDEPDRWLQTGLPRPDRSAAVRHAREVQAIRRAGAEGVSPLAELRGFAWDSGASEVPELLPSGQVIELIAEMFGLAGWSGS